MATTPHSTTTSPTSATATVSVTKGATTATASRTVTREAQSIPPPAPEPDPEELPDEEAETEAPAVEVYTYERISDGLYVANLMCGDTFRYAFGRDADELQRFVTSALISEFHLTQEGVDDVEVVPLSMPAPTRKAKK